MTVSDFEVAKQVADLFAGMERDRQERVLRWVSESLGITPVAPRSAPPSMPPAPGGPVEHLPATHSSGTTDIKSFMDSKDPRSDVQFATAAAYFYRFEASAAERRDAIDAEILQDAARLAGRARFNSPLKTLNNAKQQGYLDTPERGSFRINSVGENLVAMTLPSGEGATATRHRPSSKRRTTRKAGRKGKPAAKGRSKQKPQSQKKNR